MADGDATKASSRRHSFNTSHESKYPFECRTAEKGSCRTVNASQSEHRLESTWAVGYVATGHNQWWTTSHTRWFAFGDVLVGLITVGVLLFMRSWLGSSFHFLQAMYPCMFLLGQFRIWWTPTHAARRNSFQLRVWARIDWWYINCGAPPGTEEYWKSRWLGWEFPTWTTS